MTYHHSLKLNEFLQVSIYVAAFYTAFSCTILLEATITGNQYRSLVRQLFHSMLNLRRVEQPTQYVVVFDTRTSHSNLMPPPLLGMNPEEEFVQVSTTPLDTSTPRSVDEEICDIEVKEVDNGFEVYEVVSSPPSLVPDSDSLGAVSRSNSDEANLQTSPYPNHVDDGTNKRRRQFSEALVNDSDEDNNLELMAETAEKVKNKFKSMWNNMKYGWTVRLKTNFSVSAPIVLLGRYYFDRNSERPIPDTNGRMYHPSIEAFTQDFTSRLWFTYRRGFPPVGQSQLTTDCGWGCMVRTGQMMLAQALVVHFLGREWSLFQRYNHPHDVFHRQIIRWFGDLPSHDAPFSIHNLVEWSRKSPGQWLGPVTIAQALQTAYHSSLAVAPLLDEMRVYVAYDNCVYIRDLLDLAYDNSPPSSIPVNTEQNQPSNWHSLFVIIPLWLGGAKGFNPIYEPCLKSLLADDSCVGIIGGKPKHSMYFVGWQEEKLIYLDPHYCQETVPTNSHDFNMQSFHCFAPRKISCSKLDPSCAIGFYLRSRADVDKWMKRMQEQSTPPMQKSAYHMFEFKSGRSREEQEAVDDLTGQMNDQILRVRKFNTTSGRTSTEEYVLL